MSPLYLGIGTYVIVFLGGLTIGLTFATRDKKPIYYLNYITAILGLILGAMLMFGIVVNCQ